MKKENEYEKYRMENRSLKYNFDEIPKNYFTHETVLINDIFYKIFEDEMSPNESIEDIEDFYNLSLEDIKNKLVEEGYFKENLKFDNIDERLDSFNPKKLKRILKNNDLKVPKTLEEQRALIKSEIPEKVAPKELIITKKAKNFWKDNKNKLELYLDCCDFFYYQEFYDLCINNSEKSDGENLVEFIDMHYDLAIKRNDHGGLMHCLDSKGYYYNVLAKDYKKGCDELLKQYILSVNPIYLSKKYYKYYKAITEALNVNLNAIIDELSKEYLLKRFDELWNEYDFDKILIPYNDALDYLNQIIEDENNYKKINKNIKLKLKQ